MFYSCLILNFVQFPFPMGCAGSRRNLRPLCRSLISRNIRVLPDPGITKGVTQILHKGWHGGHYPATKRRAFPGVTRVHSAERRGAPLLFHSQERRRESAGSRACNFSDDVFIGLLVPSTRGFTFARVSRTCKTTPGSS